MRKIIITISFICFSYFSAIAAASAIGSEGNKIALLVAVSDYPMEGGWAKINSFNDVDIVKAALLKQGFLEADITVIKDANATREGILKAINELSRKATPGDIVYFQFSGHGQQVFDDNGDEADGYDEAIVPINSPMFYSPGENEGQFLIRDDELGNLFTTIRTKLTPAGNLMVLLDACHSGTGTRGFGTARGTTHKMAGDEYKAAQVHSRGGEDNSLNEGNARGSQALAPMIAFFGSAHNQLNFETIDEEGKNVGSLSYAFSKKFSQADANTTYRGLFEQIKLEMSSIAPRQRPQVEGALDQQILGGAILGQPAYQSVKSFREDDMTVTIEGGWLKGLNEGSIIGLFPPETRDISKATPLAKGTVILSKATTSKLSLDKSLSKETALSAWAFVLEQSFGNMKIDLKLNLPEGAIKNMLFQKWSGLPVINWSESPELILLENNGKLELITPDDQVLGSWRKNIRSELLEFRAKEAVFAFAQGKFLRNLEYSNYDLAVDFEMIPIKWDRNKSAEVDRYSISERTDGGGTIRFKAGKEVIKIKVFNDGSKPAYFTLVDVQPNNVINVLIPSANQTPGEFLVQPGEEMEISTPFEIYEPYGTEVFKLIATEQPIDLRNVVKKRAGASRGIENTSPVEKLFESPFLIDGTSHRGGRSMNVGAGSMNVVSKTFVIEE